MNFAINREALLTPLQMVIGVVERRQTLPILANVLLKVDGDQLSVTATDLEVELVGKTTLEKSVDGSIAITAPGRKLFDIVKSLPDSAHIQLQVEKANIIVQSGRSRFKLATLPATDFPLVKGKPGALEFNITQTDLRHLTQRTHFAMAQQDVRYYLNGMLLEVNDGMVRTVATDGHRLAFNALEANVINTTHIQVIIPRKGVLELLRLLGDDDQEVHVSVSDNYIRIQGPQFIFTSKLIDGRFPDYQKVLPRGGDKQITVDRETFKQSLSRTAILSNEKFRGIRLQLRNEWMHLLANNAEQEEAQEEVGISYNGENLDIGFNVNYLLEILSNINAEQISLTFSDGNSSVLVEEPGNDGNSLYVVMPLRL